MQMNCIFVNLTVSEAYINMREMETYMTPKEIMEHLQIGKDKACSLCALKGFPAIKFGSAYFLMAAVKCFDAGEVMEWPVQWYI